MSDRIILLSMVDYQMSEEGVIELCFDLFEALSCIHHDWGEYWLSNVFHEVQFRPRPNLTYCTLEPIGQMLYDVIDEALWKQHYSTPCPLKNCEEE